MEIPNQEPDMPIPLNTTFGLTHHHLIHHDLTSQSHMIVPSSDEHVVNNSFKKTVKYKECLKNHAASMGGNATDGCGEFMPSGEEGSLEALTCSACNCHRNFHRKEIEGELTFPNFHENYCYPNINPRIGRKIFVGHNHNAMGALIASRPMAMSYNMGGNLPSESEEEMGVRQPHVKKRFRTKFSQEQKEKMLSFAEKVGWKIQKQEESVVQQFCQEIGVKRRVLNIWMHNNKHSLAKKNNNGSGEANDGGNDQV